MKLKIFLWLILVFSAALGIFAADSLLTQRALAEKTVRLHVVANSDAEDDQAQKLRVRDAVLEAVSALTAECRNSDEAQQIMRENLNVIESAARDVLRAEGSDYALRVSLGTERFDTRRYDTFTLPAGRYPALRVSIGAAEGKNWWCVVFPSLCMAATSDAVRQCAEVGGYDGAESALVTGGEERYVVRFKTLEWLQKVVSWFD